MMSSDGCSARQSMYSANCSPSTKLVRHLHRLAGFGAEVAVTAVADGLLVRLGDAEEHADDPHGHLGAEVGDDVEAVGADERVEARRRRSSRIFGSSAATFFGVNTRDSRLRWMVWVGGSSKMTTPGGISMSALMSSRIPPRPEMYVSRSTSPRSTSS